MFVSFVLIFKNYMHKDTQLGLKEMNKIMVNDRCCKTKKK